MIITYLRSSSYNAWDYCQLQYYIDYVLGYKQVAGKKADMGTIVHKVMECLANIKLELQNNPDATSIYDENIGEIEFDSKNLMTPTFLSREEIETINKGRINKKTYLSPCKLEDGHVRFGVELVEAIFEKSYNHYVDKTDHDWKRVDRRDCLNFTWMALDYKNGMFDPRKRNIFASETAFDLTFEEDWAEYYWVLPNGEEATGRFSIKGTIDLVTQPTPGTLEVIDWKTGQRKAWGKKGTPKKTLALLQQDPQLMLYFYALMSLYPEVDHIMLTIFFIRDGGPFTVYFDRDQLPQIVRMLRDRFNAIRMNENPKPCDKTRRDFRCKLLCDFYKKKFADSDEKPMCWTIENEIKEHGIEYVTVTRTNPGHNVSKYHAPGGE